VTFSRSGRVVVRVTNSGSKPVVVDASRAGFALSLRGRPRIVRAAGARSAARWLEVQPKRLALPARTSASLVVSAKVPPKAEPGDHDALVLLTTRPVARAGVAVRVRLGVMVVVRAPGAVVRRLELRRLRVVRRRASRLLDLTVANRGNVTETVRAVRLTIARDRSRQTLVAASREFRPRTRGILEFRLHRRIRGTVRARVVVPATRGRGRIVRVYRIRI
jgi:hypothetical protein